MVVYRLMTLTFHMLESQRTGSTPGRGIFSLSFLSFFFPITFDRVYRQEFSVSAFPQ